MNRLKALGVFCVCLAMPAMSHAGGLVQSLPKDGTWVKYYVELKVAEPQKTDIFGTYTLRSVGRAQIDGAPCRWIELHLEQTQDGVKTSTLTKVLVAEKDLNSKSERAPKIIRGWIKTNGADARELSDTEKTATGRYPFMIAAPLKDRKTLNKEKVIDFQKGRLTIKSGFVGTASVKTADGPENARVLTTESVWSDSSIPFGTAAMQIDMQYKVGKNAGPKMVMSLTVRDYGTEAKSALPDRE